MPSVGAEPGSPALSSVEASVPGEPRQQKTGGARKRYYYMDALNVLACLAVVALHCSTPVFQNEGGLFWRYCVVIQSVFIFAVPIFFMISGANLLGYRKRYSTRDFFKKRMKRILWVFIGCSILIYCLQCLPINALGGAWRTPSLKDFIWSFLDNSINNIYWYFYAIIGLYLVTPIFSKIADDKNLLAYAIVICFIMSVVFPLTTRYLNGYNLLGSFTYPYLSSWLLYFLAGYYINEHLDRSVPFSALIVAAVISMVFMFVMTVHTNDAARLLDPAAGYDSFYANAMGLPGFMLSASIFIGAKQLNGTIGASPLYPRIKALSALSLGVYAIHLQILQVFTYYTGIVTSHSMIIRAVIVYALTAALVWCYRLAKSKVKQVLPTRDSKGSRSGQ